MAKTLSFTDTSPQTVKIGDTTTCFTLVCGNDNVATDLTSATSITVKLGNTSGYLRSATVDPTSLTDPTTGQVIVTFSADLMTSLTAGDYAIEVWVVDSNGTSIYPSDGSTGFTITSNIQSTNGSTITTITFDDFVNKFNTIAANALPGTTDTTNFQKRKITSDSGDVLVKVTNTQDLNQALLSNVNGLATVYCAYGATNNPSKASIRGIAYQLSGFGFGYFNPIATDTSTSLYIAHIQDGSVTWTKATTTTV
ncbi:hypothetical protein [Lactiplantibacillus argentoratensis]|uniref:hypothetical protein n=1 Tax=Lactiplantibacillus argentoratensis TaxID=271881 RepID=UPI0021AA1DFE|nr:hypothetical protein [Lactiplantibacillus argentoratensis]